MLEVVVRVFGGSDYSVFEISERCISLDCLENVIDIALAPFYSQYVPCSKFDHPDCNDQTF